MNFSYYENLGLNEPWAILPQYAQGYYPVLAALLKGDSLAQSGKDHSEMRQKAKPFFISSETDGFEEDEFNIEMNAAPEGSIAVLNLKGPIMKYSQFCGPMGTVDLAAQLKKIDADENFIGIVMVTESGGGQAFAIKVLTDQMDKRTKPIVILGGNVVASAAYAIAVHGDEIIIDHPRAIIGSIGTMNMIQNVQPALEKLGVQFHEIYATDSILKNNTFNQALKGNYAPIKKHQLDPLNKDFQQDVNTQRPNLSSNKAIMQGETFMATEALELKMIDYLGDMELAKSRVKELSKNYKNKPSKQTQSSNMNEFKNVLALAGIATPTAAQMDLANAELTLAGITHVTMVQESFITEAANATEENNRLTVELQGAQTALQTANASLTAVQTSLTEANSKVKGLEAQVEAFGKNAGAVHNQATGGDNHADKETESSQVISNLPHNKAAYEALGL